MKNMPNIPGYCFTKSIPVTKGLSGDRKYYLETEDGKRFMVRIAKKSEYERKQSAYRLLEEAAKIGVFVPDPVDFGYCGNGDEIYTLLTWVEGEEAGTLLPKLSLREQYHYGMEAGKILRRFHDNSRREDREDWQSRYFAVIEPRLAAYCKEGIPFEGSDAVLDYIKENRNLLSKRPQTLHHGDFHIGNLVIRKDGRLGVIDWDSADFGNTGDPWYEFNRIRAELPAFATGQIDGYFYAGNVQKPIPDEFWRLLALYHAGSAITAIVWAKYFAPECMDEIMRRNRDIVGWYDHMKNPIPIWYDKNLQNSEG